MDFYWLEDVLALLEEGNMTRAARRRNITQPAFSRRIRSFEDWLGTPILVRKANAVDITQSLAFNEAEIRAIVFRLKELRTKIAHHDVEATTLAVSAQHASVSSAFPDMVLQARSAFSHVKFRLRPDNLSECVSTFLRGDTSLLLCYEGQGVAPLQFGPDVLRGRWGRDKLVPVVGGDLRNECEGCVKIADDTPGLVYPESSSFGMLLHRAERPFGTRDFSVNPVCETAFSSGIRELVLRGLGIGWLPLNMVQRDIESGAMVLMSKLLGEVALDVIVHADGKNKTAVALLDIWSA